MPAGGKTLPLNEEPYRNAKILQRRVTDSLKERQSCFAASKRTVTPAGARVTAFTSKKQSRNSGGLSPSGLMKTTSNKVSYKTCTSKLECKKQTFLSRYASKDKHQKPLAVPGSEPLSKRMAKSRSQMNNRMLRSDIQQHQKLFQVLQPLTPKKASCQDLGSNRNVKLNLHKSVDRSSVHDTISQSRKSPGGRSGMSGGGLSVH